MGRDPRAFLWDVLENADAISQFVHGREQNDYLADGMLRAAVERKLEIIGEALNQLSKVAPELAARVPEAAQAIGLRNVLIHGYTLTDNNIVWRTIQTDIPRLRTNVDALLDELGGSQ